MDGLGEKLLVSSSHFPPKIRGRSGGSIFRGIPRKLGKSPRMAHPGSTGLRPARHQPAPKCEAYRPSCHYTTDGCGPPTCGWCSVRVSECQFFRGNPRNSHFPRKNVKIPKLRFRKIFLISQRHPWHARMTAKC